MTAIDIAAPAKGPLSFPVFRALWIATIISNIGTWMHDVGAGWSRNSSLKAGSNISVSMPG